VEGIAYGIGAACTGSDRAAALAFQTKTDGYLCGRHVHDGHGHKIGADLVEAFLLPTGVLLLDDGQTADAAGQDHAGLLRSGRNIQSAVRQCFSGGSQGKLCKPGHLAGLAAVDGGAGVKILDFGSQGAGQRRSIELGDGADAAASLPGGGPALGSGQTQGADHAKAGDHNSAFFHVVSSFQIAMPPSTHST